MFTATLSNASEGVTTIHTDQGDITIADGATTGTLDHCLGQRRGRLYGRLQPDGQHHRRLRRQLREPHRRQRHGDGQRHRHRHPGHRRSHRLDRRPRAPAPATCSRRRCRTPRKASPPSTPTRATSRIADGATTGTLTIASGNGEDVYRDASSLTASITGVSGGNFESLTVGSGTATANVTDTVTPATVDLTASTVDRGLRRQLRVHGDAVECLARRHHHPHRPGRHQHRRRRHHRHADHCLGQRRGRLYGRLQPDGAASPASPAATSRASPSAAARRPPTSPTPSPRRR